MTHLQSIILIVLASIALGACETAPLRNPSESGDTDAKFRDNEIADVIVLPVSNAVPEEDLPKDRAFTFPEKHARESMRLYLIQDRDYAVPKSEWVDSREPANFDTDATLDFELTQWDSSRLLRRGVIYAGGRFSLKATGSRKTLWTYEAFDLQIPLTPPYGGQAVETNMRDAAKKFVELGLARLPRKITK